MSIPLYSNFSGEVLILFSVARATSQKIGKTAEVRGRIETTSLVGFNRGKIDGIT